MLASAIRWCAWVKTLFLLFYKYQTVSMLARQTELSRLDVVIYFVPVLGLLKLLHLYLNQSC